MSNIFLHKPLTISLILGGLLLVQPATNQEFSKEIRKSSSVESFNFLGVLSVALDSLTRDMFSSQLLTLIEADRDFSISNWIYKLEKVNNKYRRSLDSFDFLSANLPELDKPLLFLTFEKDKSLYKCSVYIIKEFKSELTATTSINFIPDIKKHIRNAAVHMHELIRADYSLTVSGGNQRSVFKLKKPVLGAVLTHDDRVVKNDTITKISTGNTLVMGSEAEIYYIRSQKFKYILYPSSAYTFYSPSIIDIKRGRLGIIQTDFDSKITTGSMVCETSSAIADIVVGDATTLMVYAGKVKARPVKETKGFKKVTGRMQVSTNGFVLKSSGISDSAFTENLQIFKPLLNSRIVSHFKSSKNILDFIPSNNIDFFIPDVNDPVNYFMASELNDLGIPMDALSFEGESWDHDKNLFKSGVNETGCYLCSPNRVDLD